MLGKNSDRKINVTKVNDLVSTGNKILKILYILFIMLLVYVLSLIFKEWGILSFIGKVIATISPLFIGYFIAWLLNPFVRKLREKRVNKALSVVIAYATLIGIVYLVFAFTLPSLGDQIADVVSSIPSIVADVNVWINDIFLKLSNMTLQNLDSVKASFINNITEFASGIETELPAIAVNVVSSVVSGIGTIILSLIIAFYISFDYDKFANGFINLFPKTFRKEVKVLTNKLSDTIYGYVNGTLWLSVLLFVISVIGFSIIGLNAPVLIAFVCIITNLIPYIGPYMGAGIAAIIGFAESPIIGILTLIFILIVQTVEGNFLQPLMMSKKMNLSPITIIVSLLIFGYFWGIFGMVIATPLTAIIKILYEFFDDKYHFFEYRNE